MLVDANADGIAQLRKFFQREFQGILVTAFWGAYNAIRCLAKQHCLAQLLRDLLQHEVCTFLDHPEVPDDNNTAERALRPAVIIGTNSYANRSAAGADRQAVLMSLLRTLKQRGHNPLQTIVQALRTYLQTGQLPPLPDKVAANG